MRLRRVSSYCWCWWWRLLGKQWQCSDRVVRGKTTSTPFGKISECHFLTDARAREEPRGLFALSLKCRSQSLRDRRLLSGGKLSDWRWILQQESHRCIPYAVPRILPVSIRVMIGRKQRWRFFFLAPRLAVVVTDSRNAICHVRMLHCAPMIHPNVYVTQCQSCTDIVAWS